MVVPGHMQIEPVFYERRIQCGKPTALLGHTLTQPLFHTIQAAGDGDGHGFNGNALRQMVENRTAQGRSGHR